MRTRLKLYEAIERVKCGQQLKVLVVAIQLPTGAIEIITNHEDISSKLHYYLEAYDDQCALKTNNAVKLLNLMFV